MIEFIVISDSRFLLPRFFFRRRRPPPFPPSLGVVFCGFSHPRFLDRSTLLVPCTISDPRCTHSNSIIIIIAPSALSALAPSPPATGDDHGFAHNSFTVDDEEDAPPPSYACIQMWATSVGCLGGEGEKQERKRDRRQNILKEKRWDKKHSNQSPSPLSSFSPDKSVESLFIWCCRGGTFPRRLPKHKNSQGKR